MKKVKEYEKINTINANNTRKLANYVIQNKNSYDIEEEKENIAKGQLLDNEELKVNKFQNHDVQHHSYILNISRNEEFSNKNYVRVSKRSSTDKKLISDFWADKEITKIVWDIRYLK